MSSANRLIGLVILLSPGLFLLHLALTASFGPLENVGAGVDPSTVALLTMAVLALCFGMAVHNRAVKDYRRLGRAYAKTVLFITAPSLVAALLMLTAAEIAASLLPTRASALIFPPNSSVTIHTSEFEFTTKTNSIGIRDREVDVKEKGGYRIVAIGDSFTQGWGVSQQEAWPSLLERRLRSAGRDVEVLNLGVAGASPRDYALLARHAVPQLRPDLVLVAVLQGDDLAQTHLKTGKRVRPAAQKVIEWLAPNLTRQFNRFSAARSVKISAEQMKVVWQRQVRETLSAHSGPTEAKRWAALDPEVRQMYQSGDLNPGWLSCLLKDPSYFALTFDLARPEAQAATDAMAAHFEDIADAARQVGAECRVISVPFAPYVSRESLDHFRRLGFRLNDAMPNGDAPDAAIRIACDKAGVGFHSVTDQFRGACANRSPFYKFDGHFNPEGNRVYAEAVAKWLLDSGLPKAAARPSAVSVRRRPAELTSRQPSEIDRSSG